MSIKLPIKQAFLLIDLKQIKITSLTNNYPKKAIQPPIDGPFFVCYGLSYTIAALMAHGLQRMAKVMGPIGSHRFLCGAWVHGGPIDGPFFRMLYVWARLGRHSWLMGYERTGILWGPCLYATGGAHGFELQTLALKIINTFFVLKIVNTLIWPFFVAHGPWVPLYSSTRSIQRMAHRWGHRGWVAFLMG